MGYSEVIAFTGLVVYTAAGLRVERRKSVCPSFSMAVQRCMLCRLSFLSAHVKCLHNDKMDLTVI